MVLEVALIPIDETYMVRQARLELECVIRDILEGGLDRDDVQAAWKRAMGHICDVAARQSVDQL